MSVQTPGAQQEPQSLVCRICNREFERKADAPGPAPTVCYDPKCRRKAPVVQWRARKTAGRPVVLDSLPQLPDGFCWRLCRTCKGTRRVGINLCGICKGTGAMAKKRPTRGQSPTNPPPIVQCAQSDLPPGAVLDFLQDELGDVEIVAMNTADAYLVYCVGCGKTVAVAARLQAPQRWTPGSDPGFRACAIFLNHLMGRGMRTLVALRFRDQPGTYVAPWNWARERTLHAEDSELRECLVQSRDHRGGR